MSNGPIQRERDGVIFRPPKKFTFAVGDQVQLPPEVCPPGYVLWKVLEVPPHPVASDPVLLESLSRTSRPMRIRRRVDVLVAA